MSTINIIQIISRKLVENANETVNISTLTFSVIKYNNVTKKKFEKNLIIKNTSTDNFNNSIILADKK